RYFFTYPDLAPDGLEGLALTPNGLTQEGTPAPPKFNEPLADRLWADMRLRHYQKPDDSVDAVSWDYFLKDYGMARLWMALPEMREARSLASQAGPRISPARLQEARALYEKCLPHLLWAYDWDPQNAAYAVNVGMIHFKMGDQKEALDWFLKGTRIDPTYTEAFYDAGVAAAQLGDPEEAGQLFQKTLLLDPQHAQAAQALRSLQNK